MLAWPVLVIQDAPDPIEELRTMPMSARAAQGAASQKNTISLRIQTPILPGSLLCVGEIPDEKLSHIDSKKAVKSRLKTKSQAAGCLMSYRQEQMFSIFAEQQ